MKSLLACAGLSCVAMLAPTRVLAEGLSASRQLALRDARSYAASVCLILQSNSYLKDQGYGWASVLSEGRDRNLDKLKSVQRAVQVELARHRMIVIADEQLPQRSKDLPVAYCGEIAYAPGVRSAINLAAARLGRKTR